MRKFEVVKESMRRTNGEITLPTRGSKFSAGYDFYSPCHIVINPNEQKMIWTDVKAQFNENEVLLLFVRSSMGKQPIVLSNGTGVVDFDYYNSAETDGNIGFRLRNLGEKPYEINVGDRIGQGVLIPFLTFENGNTDNKRTGGFGSTNKENK